MEQYGFSLQGNPFDTVDFTDVKLHGNFLSRDAVLAAASAAKRASGEGTALAVGLPVPPVQPTGQRAAETRADCVATSVMKHAGWK